MLALASLVDDALGDAALLGLSVGLRALGPWRLAVRYEFFEGGVRVPRAASPARPRPAGLLTCTRARHR